MWACPYSSCAWWEASSSPTSAPDAQGIHARPASELVKELKGVTSVVKLTKEGKTVEAKKLMAVMSLGIKCGQEVTVTVEGEDEDAVAEKLENFFKTNL